MNGSLDMYDESDWARISAAHPLAVVRDEDLGLLHRHWMWANQQRAWFYNLLSCRNEPFDAGMYLAGKAGGAMVVWYGMLWAVIEALCEDRRIEFVSPLSDDLATISDPLRRCRNAVMHVPRSGDYFDQRILDLLSLPSSVRLVRTVHTAFGRLLLEEMQQRSR